MIHEWAGRDGSDHTVHTGRLHTAWVGKGRSQGAALVLAVAIGAAAALLVPAGIGVPTGCWAAAVSLLARARTAGGRVRFRLRLFAVSEAAGGLHRLLVDRIGSSRAHSDTVLQFVIRPLAVAGIVVCLVVAVAGLMMVAADNGTTLMRLRRLLDGWLISGSLLTLGWILLLDRADRGGDLSASLLGLAPVVTDILLLGLLVALRFCLNRAERTAVTVAASALALLGMGDMLRVLLPGPGTWYGIPPAAVCSMAGLLLLTVVPWLPGGVSALGVDQRMMPVIGVVAAFVPVAVCALAVAVHVAVGGSVDMVMSGLAGSVLLVLGARQGVTHADHLRIINESAEREVHYRTLVDGTCDVITIVSPEGWVLYVSPAVHQVFGYRPEEFVGAALPFFCHPDDVETLMQAVRTLREEAGSGIRGRGRRVSCRVRAADGQWRHMESTISHHPRGMVFVSRDVSDRVAQLAQLEHLAFHDALTGLPNRALFADRVAHALRKRAASGTPPVVLFVDLDDFKAVNDSAGHAAGDALLAHAAGRLKASVRAGDTVARLGGDEFAALLEWDADTDPSSAHEVAQRILATLTRPYRLSDKKVVVSASIGMAVADPGITPQRLLHHADLAMYAAKAAGKGRIRSHHPHAHSGTLNH